MQDLQAQHSLICGGVSCEQQLYNLRDQYMQQAKGIFQEQRYLRSKVEEAEHDKFVSDGIIEDNQEMIDQGER